MPEAASLIGTWKMESWKREFVATGEHIDALGPDPMGYISYGPDHRFHALVVSKERRLPEKLPPSDGDKLALFDSMLAYAGTYSVDHEKVVHHVDASWNQAWTGTDQVRFYVLDQDALTLSGALAPDPYTGSAVFHRIRAKRVSLSAL